MVNAAATPAVRAAQRPSWRILGLTLAIAFGYSAVRHFMYRRMPIHTDLDWFYRDLTMTIPRLAGFVLCLFVMKSNGGFRRWGCGWGVSKSGLTALALVSLMEILRHLARGRHSSLSGGQVFVGWLDTAAVGLFEEAAFRALLFLTLLDNFSPRTAAFIASVTFAVWHIEAQPVFTWLHIFVFGMGACAALYAGVGLYWLIAAHWFVDGVWFHFSEGTGAAWAFPTGNIAMILAIVGSVYVLGRENSQITPGRAAESST